MSSRQFIGQTQQIADYFRRFGLEGEAAFQAVAYQYLLCFRERLSGLPPLVEDKWQAAYGKIEREHYVVDFVNGIVSQDGHGDQLPDWYQFFVGRRYRAGSGKFFTPKPVASTMARFLPRKPDPVVMDSTCGGGTFLLEASQIWKDGPCTLVANDVERSLVELAMVTLGLAASPRHIKYYSSANIFDPTPDFTRWYGRVDYILANPPFSLRIDHEEFASELFLSGYRNSDALFIDSALQLLKPGGRLVCLLPHSIIANQEFSTLRTITEKSWHILGVICLPEGVFNLSAGTTTRADIVIMEKRAASLKRPTKLIFASVPSVGIRLNNLSTAPVANDLQALLASADVKEVLGV
jgi:type I restriction-modification system DNA methylase subunit